MKPGPDHRTHLRRQAHAAYRSAQDRINAAWLISMGVQIRLAANRPATIDGVDETC